jgi:hypothetical protein
MRLRIVKAGEAGCRFDSVAKTARSGRIADAEVVVNLEKAG